MCWWLLHPTRGIYSVAQKSPFAFPNTVVKLICKDRQINNCAGNSSCYFRELEKMNVLSSVLASCAQGRLTSLGRILRAQSSVPGVCFTGPGLITAAATRVHSIPGVSFSVLRINHWLAPAGKPGIIGRAGYTS